ncbi:hypothetical protein NQ317_009703 [Molorchus minor]|uniref:Uncharacterized protein n=1 Tax=Molorchus minor TaxID=1323400 RepID=A0ABQ9JGR8_9CUCU|nr:hypothetical protein NQ317_009703 [Molorchus minor]
MFIHLEFFFYIKYFPLKSRKKISLDNNRKHNGLDSNKNHFNQRTFKSNYIEENGKKCFLSYTTRKLNFADSTERTKKTINEDVFGGVHDPWATLGHYA